MRRAVWGLPLLVLVASIMGGSLTAQPPAARAQTGPPPVEIHRVQDAAHTPARAQDDPIFILVMGSDARPGEKVTRQRSDSLHIVALNAKEGAGGILGFPRDSYVNVPGAGQRRINEGLFYGGPKLQVRTVEELTNIPIDYYMLTSFPGFQAIVRGIGGVRIEIKYRMNDSDAGTNLKPGMTKLNGKEALAFTRDRHSAPGGDFGRSENQGRFMLAALTKLQKQMEKDPALILKWIRVGMRNVTTDLSLIQIFDLATAATQVDPAKIGNKVVTGANVMVGPAAVVQLSGASEAVYDDLRDDGVFND